MNNILQYIFYNDINYQFFIFHTLRSVKFSVNLNIMFLILYLLNQYSICLHIIRTLKILLQIFYLIFYNFNQLILGNNMKNFLFKSNNVFLDIQDIYFFFHFHISNNQVLFLHDNRNLSNNNLLNIIYIFISY